MKKLFLIFSGFTFILFLAACGSGGGGEPGGGGVDVDDVAAAYGATGAAGPAGSCLSTGGTSCTEQNLYFVTTTVAGVCDTATSDSDELDEYRRCYYYTATPLSEPQCGAGDLLVDVDWDLTKKGKALVMAVTAGGSQLPCDYDNYEDPEPPPEGSTTPCTLVGIKSCLRTSLVLPAPPSP